MDFFAHQDKARLKSGRLILLFLLGILSVVCAVYLAAIFVWFYLNKDDVAGGMAFRWFDGRLFLIIGGVTLTVIVVSSLLKIYALSQGGRYVAESLGGRLLNRSAADRNERKLLNVVEEMSIAAGVPVPQVYVLDGEKSINAFAAGFSPDDAVVGVTGGCMTILIRDELQGVLAHEFSHILNGDMRLNIRLIGGLAGIMTISQIGYTILRNTERRSGSSKSGNDGNALYLFAFLLLVIGYVGAFFARLIQIAVSRQREFLADASAVQFTRNPLGIAGALKKIGGLSFGSVIQSPAAGESCHMFFEKALRSLFSTHPPLIERIRRIEPSFNGKFPEVSLPIKGKEAEGAEPEVVKERPERGETKITLSADRVVGLAGNISAEAVEYGAVIVDAVPAGLAGEIDDIMGASSVVMALLIDEEKAVREKQHEILEKMLPSGLVRHIQKMEKDVRGLDARLRLPLLDMAMPSLRLMSEKQLEDFLRIIESLIRADSKITLFEFALKTILTHRLTRAIKKPRERVRIRNIGRLSQEISGLVSTLSLSGHKEMEQAERAFQLAANILPFRKSDFVFNTGTTPAALERALDRLSSASPAIKKRVLDACAQAVLFDGKVSIREAELLRATAYAMDIPLPPFLSVAAEE